jgi:glucose/arabinose dehydrogenase
MSPEPLIKGGLQVWIKRQPLGAAWDTEERRADVLSYDPNGKNEKIVAVGLRNCAGITIQPATGLPWCMVIRVDNEDATIATMKAAVNRGAIVSISR